MSRDEKQSDFVGFVGSIVECFGGGVYLGVYWEVWASVATNGETAPVRSRSSRTWKHFYEANLGKLELSNRKKRKEEKKRLK